jgi:hypothetical protein
VGRSAVSFDVQILLLSHVSEFNTDARAVFKEQSFYLSTLDRVTKKLTAFYKI